MAPTVVMSLRALANAFTHKEMGPLLQIHVGTVAAVYAESMKQHGSNKMVQVCKFAVKRLGEWCASVYTCVGVQNRSLCSLFTYTRL